MKAIAALALSTLAGCAAHHATRDFYAREEAIARTCMQEVLVMPLAARIVVDPKTMRSPMTQGAICYATRIQQTARHMDYAHQDKVYQFSAFLVRLGEAHDAGRVDTKTALDAYMQSATEFRAAISLADQSLQARELAVLTGKIALFSAAMAAAMAAQHPTAAYLPRPITCTEFTSRRYRQYDCH